ncbi:hypothetical protein AYI68_g3559, partial [Smittium mucronatum]
MSRHDDVLIDSPLSMDSFEAIINIHHKINLDGDVCPLKELETLPDSTWIDVLDIYNKDQENKVTLPEFLDCLKKALELYEKDVAEAKKTGDVSKCPYYTPRATATAVDFEAIKKSPHTKYIDLGVILDSSKSMNSNHLRKIISELKAVEEDRFSYNVIVWCRFDQLEYYNQTDITSVTPDHADAYFMPHLDLNDKQVVPLSVELQLLIRKISKLRPMYSIVTGRVAITSLPILLSVKNLILTEYFNTY